MVLAASVVLSASMRVMGMPLPCPCHALIKGMPSSVECVHLEMHVPQLWMPTHVREYTRFFAIAAAIFVRPADSPAPPPLSRRCAPPVPPASPVSSLPPGLDRPPSI